METRPILAVISPGRYARTKGVSYETVNVWRRAGKLECTRTPGGQYRIVIRDPLEFELLVAVGEKR